MSGNDFEQRNGEHERAFCLVRNGFDLYGFQCYIVGAESDVSALQDALRQQDDDVSILWRYRPDLLIVKPGDLAVLCELKSDADGHKNFAIEADSLLSAKEWAQIVPVMYAFVDVEERRVTCAWATDIPVPKMVFVPTMRQEWQDDIQRLQGKWPDTEFIPKSDNGGSGTPYFLLPKDDRRLIPWREFINGLEQAA